MLIVLQMVQTPRRDEKEQQLTGLQHTVSYFPLLFSL